MNIPRLIISVVAIGFGAYVFVFGGMDDSPGAQGLGLLLIVAGIFGAVKSKKKLSS